jgi:hypothetical protein
MRIDASVPLERWLSTDVDVESGRVFLLDLLSPSWS